MKPPLSVTALTTDIVGLHCRLPPGSDLAVVFTPEYWAAKYHLTNGEPFTGYAQVDYGECSIKVAITREGVHEVKRPGGQVSNEDLAAEAIMIAETEGLKLSKAVWRVSWRAEGDAKPESKWQRIHRIAKKMRHVRNVSEKAEPVAAE